MEAVSLLGHCRRRCSSALRDGLLGPRRELIAAPARSGHRDRYWQDSRKPMSGPGPQKVAPTLFRAESRAGDPTRV